MKRRFVVASGGTVAEIDAADLPEPDQTVARCDCGHYDCGSTDVEITRRGGQVYWDWQQAAPIDRSVVFDAVQYDREIARIADEVVSQLSGQSD
jgi:hypothetical protein